MSQASSIPLCGAKWAAKSEAYARLISEHLSPDTVWLDVGCGSRVLEDDLDALEQWLVGRCKSVFGIDVAVTSNQNIHLLAQSSIDRLPFPDNALDLITCRMVVEHLEEPGLAFAEVFRCLRPGGTFIVHTPNLLNYGVFANAVATKVMPSRWRLRLVQSMDNRAEEDIFPVRYRANTMSSLRRLLESCGFEMHQATGVKQLRAHWHKTASIERLLMWLTPICSLLVCAHKPQKLRALERFPITKVQAPEPLASLPQPHLGRARTGS